MRLGSRLVALPAVLALAGCGATGSAPAAGGSPGVQIQMDAQNTQFSPATISVKAGDTVKVTITNKDAFTHNFSITELSVSQDVDMAATKSVTFTASSANLVFFCKYHKAKGMVGALNVGGANTLPSAPDGGATPSNGGYTKYPTY